MRVLEFISPFAGIVLSMVHADVRRDPLRAALHAAFIASRLAVGILVIVALPVYLAVWDAPGLLAVLCFAWAATPLAVAFYLSRTGRLFSAHIISAVSLSGLVIFAAALTGGTASPFLPWLLVVPAEAAISGSALIAFSTTGIAVAAMTGLAVFDATGLLPAAMDPGVPAWLLVFAITVAALAYMGALAARDSILTRTVAEQGIARSDRLRAIVNAAGELVLTLRRNGNVTFAVGANSVLGVPGNALTGEGLFARIHVADRAHYMKALDEAADGATATVELRVRQGPLDAPPVYADVEMRCDPLRDKTGHADAPDSVAVLRQVDSRRLSEREFAEANERANIAKDRFLANVSHELRTPLNAIIGFSEMLTSELHGRLGEEKHREYVGLIHESGQHLLDVVNEILDMAKLDAGTFEINPEPFDIAALVEKCTRLMERQVADAGLHIELDLPHFMPELHADRRACKQMLLNLLSNAVKFSRPGGRIVVGAYRDGQGAAIYVADEGIGIAPHQVERIGDPFVQLSDTFDRRYAGTGLGLSVVKGLAALHGGGMEVDSELGAGTRITVRLPRAVAARQEESVEQLERRRIA